MTHTGISANLRDSEQPEAPYYDPFSREINRDPYAAFKRLRDDAPLYRNDEFDFYALSRFADIQTARLDVETYTSTDGVLFERMLDRDQPRSMLIEMDPPEHTIMRRVTSRRFTPRSINRLEGKVRELCREFLDPHVGSAGFDYVQEFAKPLPMMVTSELLGLNREQQDELRPIFDVRESLIASAEPDMQKIVEWESKIRERLMLVVAERRSRPTDDLISVLVESTVDDPGIGLRHLTDEELAAYCQILYSGGNSTTTLLMSWIAKVLADHPGQREILLDRPDLTPNAVEEILRFEPVSHTQGRTTTRDIDLYGQTVPAQSKVLLLTGAACRDERRYDRPDEFDVTRDVGNHMGFGWGIHACIGAYLARLEGRIALEETLARFPSWTVDESNTAMRISTSMRGYSRLPITF
jgi:cytochrome P450